jgi:hypothetical protein
MGTAARASAVRRRQPLAGICITGLLRSVDDSVAGSHFPRVTAQAARSSASRPVTVMFMRGCGSRIDRASMSALKPNLRAIVSNGGESATSSRWCGITI